MAWQQTVKNIRKWRHKSCPPLLGAYPPQRAYIANAASKNAGGRRMTAGKRLVSTSWRDAESYRSLSRIDRTGLMWEWTRRDPDYVAWYAQASRATGGAADAGWAPLHWGL